MPGFERMRLALRMMRRELRAGELTVLLAALLVAVAAMSSVGFFTNRVDRSPPARWTIPWPGSGQRRADWAQ